jgi:chromosome segregation ATPase
MTEQLEHIGTVLAVILSAIAVVAVFVDLGKKSQKISDTEHQVSKHEERIAAVEQGVASLPDIREDIDELQGKVEGLESLKTVPATLLQISGQIDKMQLTMVAIDRDMRASQTAAAVQTRMVEIFENQRGDFEKRMRDVEAALASHKGR